MQIFRILKQSKFQFHHNKNDFMASLRISAVISLQIFFNFFVFCIAFVYESILTKTFDIGIITSWLPYSVKDDENSCITLMLPLWLDGDFGQL